MTSYDDFIGDATAMMYMGKYDFAAEKNGSKLAAFKLWNLNFKAAPRAGVSIAHNMTTQQTWAKDKYDEAKKSSTKVGWKHDDLKFDLAATNDKYSVKVASPLVKDDWKVDGSLAYEEKPTKSCKVTAEVGAESPDMGGVVATVGLSADAEWKNEKNVFTMGDPNVSVNVGLHHAEQNVLVGFSAEHDTKDLKASEVMAVKKDQGNKYWLGYNHSDKFAQAGCVVANDEKKFQHAYELRWHLVDAKEAPQALQGYPASIVAGGKYVLSDKTTMNYSAEFGTKPSAQAKFTHKLDKNWSVASHQSFNIADVEAKHPYQLGFDVNYTL
jgi:hypothetical protein